MSLLKKCHYALKTRFLKSNRRYEIEQETGFFLVQSDIEIKMKICALITAALIALILTSCRGNSPKLTAFTNVNLVPMSSEKIVENQTVLVEGREIRAIGGSDALRIPEGTRGPVSKPFSLACNMTFYTIAPTAKML